MTTRTLSLTITAALATGVALSLTFAAQKSEVIHRRAEAAHLHVFHAARDKIELGHADDLTAAELWEINDRAPGHLLVPGFPWDNPRMTLASQRSELYGNPKDPHP